MKSEFEAYIVVIRHRHGKRVTERKYLNVPLELAAGNFERLSDLKLREAINDLVAEQARRSAPPTPATNGYDPAASQIRKAPT